MSKVVNIPGGNAIDDVIEASKAGVALKVEKMKGEEAPARIIGMHDPSRNEEAPINRAPEMTYQEAMEAIAEKTLNRPVLTERGWVTPNSSLKSGSLAA